MRIETLYEFLLLTSNLNFTETAKSFFISQSVLSGHISSLEKELGALLFVRDRHSAVSYTHLLVTSPNACVEVVA